MFSGTYLDTCVNLVICAYIADASVRLFKTLREYHANAYYYASDSPVALIISRAFSYNLPSIALGMASVCTAIYRSHHNGRLMLIPPAMYLAYIPLYWLIASVQLSSSTLDYAIWIRETHGLDYAEGMASNYFHGYLKLTLPSHNGELGIRQRIDQYSAAQNITFAVNRLIILLPDTMFINRVIESKFLEKVRPLETIMKQRAGVNRKFSNDVYRFTEPINNTFYYVALEGATPMLSFYDALNFEPSSTWQMKEMKREIFLKFYRSLKKLITECDETRHEVELVLYNAKTTNGQTRDVGEVVLAHITNLWKEGKA